jgi:hypothetical protein
VILWTTRAALDESEPSVTGELAARNTSRESSERISLELYPPTDVLRSNNLVTPERALLAMREAHKLIPAEPAAIIGVDAQSWTPCQLFSPSTLSIIVEETAASTGGSTSDTLALARPVVLGAPWIGQLGTFVAIVRIRSSERKGFGAWLAAAESELEKIRGRAAWRHASDIGIAREAFAVVTDASLFEVRLPRVLQCDTCSGGAGSLSCAGANARAQRSSLLPVQRPKNARQLLVRNNLGRRHADIPSSRTTTRVYKIAGSPVERAVLSSEECLALAQSILGQTPSVLRRMDCLVGASAPPQTRSQQTTVSPLRVVIVTGVNVRKENEMDIDLALNKRAYAAAHGYNFEFYVVDWFAEMLINSDLTKWEFAKIFMMQDALYKYPGSAWVIWVDHDTWFNPREAYRPIDLWLAAVPRSKSVALANLRALSTVVVAWRADAVEARVLLSEWLAVATSGEIECQPYDQGALQLLLLWRMRGATNNTEPFGYRCRRPYCGGNATKAFSSCNPVFVEGLERAHVALSTYSHAGDRRDGARAASNYVEESLVGRAFDADVETAGEKRLKRPRCEHNSVSMSKKAVRRRGDERDDAFICRRGGGSGGGGDFYAGLFSHADFEPFGHANFPAGELFERGLANKEVPLVEAVAETVDRPKLQCYRGASLDACGRASGANFPVVQGAEDGWLINHRSVPLFYAEAFRTEWKARNNSCYYSNLGRWWALGIKAV